MYKCKSIENKSNDYIGNIGFGSGASADLSVFQNRIQIRVIYSTLWVQIHKTYWFGAVRGFGFRFQNVIFYWPVDGQ